MWYFKFLGWIIFVKQMNWSYIDDGAHFDGMDWAPYPYVYSNVNLWDTSPLFVRMGLTAKQTVSDKSM